MPKEPKPRSASVKAKTTPAPPPGTTDAILHLDVEQRRERGRSARKKVPRSSHGQWTAPEGRLDPVALLQQQEASRVGELLPIRYGRMSVSPFTFYRGAALVMASDLATTPTSGLRVQLCGDAHLANFGAYGSPERALVFDLNDFDETLPGPWEWDVKRLAASFEIAGRHRGFSGKQRVRVLRELGKTYRESMAAFALMTELQVWYARLDIEAAFAELRESLDKQQAKRTDAMVAKAKAHDSMQAYAKLVQDVDGEPRIIDDPPLIVPIDKLFSGEERDVLFEHLGGLIRGYRRTLTSDRRHLLEQFRLVDMGRKVVGVGSVGSRAYIALFLGRDGSDPLFLQMKEAQASVLERFVGKSAIKNSGQRVVSGQRLMQATTDIFLGWQHVTGVDGVERDFYIRQLRDWKGSADLERILPPGLELYARLCGWTLARAHARSGDRIAIAAYLGSSDVFDVALGEFSREYADQNERDYALLQQAIADGRVKTLDGV
jgi:uncharacterized protein (DUF2252 family)